MSPEKRAAIVRILRGMKASNGFDAEVAADDLIEFFEAEDEVAHWKRKARRLGEYAAMLKTENHNLSKAMTAELESKP